MSKKTQDMLVGAFITLVILTAIVAVSMISYTTTDAKTANIVIMEPPVSAVVEQQLVKPKANTLDSSDYYYCETAIRNAEDYYDDALDEKRDADDDVDDAEDDVDDADEELDAARLSGDDLAIQRAWRAYMDAKDELEDEEDDLDEAKDDVASARRKLQSLKDQCGYY